MAVAASLRAAFPTAEIDWLVNTPFAGAIASHPAVSAVIPFDRKHLGRTMKGGKPGPTLAFLADLRRGDYDLAIDAQGLARSGLFAWATGAPRRIGYANAREMGWLGLTEKHDIPTTLHSVDRMLALIEAAIIPPIRDMTLHADPAILERVDRHPNLAGTRYAVLAPTSIWPGKRWPIDRFAALATELLAMGLDRVAVVGAPGERDQCEPLLTSSDPRIVDLVGDTDVAGLMAFIARAALVVANDSAALHMAVGFDRPAVALFGPTDTALVGPYQRDVDVIQHHTNADTLDHKNEQLGQEMMQRITLDEVVQACQARL
ncbi:MAG: glycosyltransferase family 9 protein [Planctomycetota bacterium]